MLDARVSQKLKETALAMVAPSKGILAADESLGTIEKRFKKINIESTEENRRAYRELLFTTFGLGDYISGVILFDETIRQSAGDGKSFVEILQAQGVLPGIKVDQGTVAMGNSPDEKITKGLEGLPERLAGYVTLGAKFAKWRAVITIGEGIPTDANILQNAQDLTAYALACQQAGLVPIVEPEVLMDGSHSMRTCEEVSEQVLTAVFEELKNHNVLIPGIILKTNMVVPGKDSGEHATSEQIAEATLRLFKKVLPDDLPGQTFLSGGQSEIEATQNLNAINKLKPSPWQLTFSYGRALQGSAIQIWDGKPENAAAAQNVFYHRAKMNGLARMGKYSDALEAATK